MKRLSKQDLLRIDSIRDKLNARVSTYNDILTRFEQELEEAKAEIEEVRQEAYGFFEDLVSVAQEYSDERSDSWHDGERGQEYSEWIERLEYTRDQFDQFEYPDIPAELDIPFEIDDIGDGLEAPGG